MSNDDLTQYLQSMREKKQGTLTQKTIAVPLLRLELEKGEGIMQKMSQTEELARRSWRAGPPPYPDPEQISRAMEEAGLRCYPAG